MASRGRFGRWDARLGLFGCAKRSPIEQSGATIWPSSEPGKASLDATFSALSDPTRRAILARLAEGEATVNELVAPFKLSQPAISKHLKVLEKAGLITRGRDAQKRPCRIAAGPLAEATEWLQEYR